MSKIGSSGRRGCSVVALVALSALAAVGCAATEAGDGPTPAAQDIVAGHPAPAAGGSLSDADLEAALHRAVDDLLFGSDTDEPFDVLRTRLAADEALTVATVKAKFTGLRETKDGKTALKDVAGSDEEPFATWFDTTLSLPQGPGEKGEQFLAGMRRVRSLMEDNLVDRDVFFFGDAVQPHFHNDGGHVQIFIVGRSRTGMLFALHTAGDFT